MNTQLKYNDKKSNLKSKKNNTIFNVFHRYKQQKHEILIEERKLRRKRSRLIDSETFLPTDKSEYDKLCNEIESLHNKMDSLKTQHGNRIKASLLALAITLGVGIPSISTAKENADVKGIAKENGFSDFDIHDSSSLDTVALHVAKKSIAQVLSIPNNEIDNIRIYDNSTAISASKSNPHGNGYSEKYKIVLPDGKEYLFESFTLHSTGETSYSTTNNMPEALVSQMRILHNGLFGKSDHAKKKSIENLNNNIPEITDDSDCR